MQEVVVGVQGPRVLDAAGVGEDYRSARVGARLPERARRGQPLCEVALPWSLFIAGPVTRAMSAFAGCQL